MPRENDIKEYVELDEGRLEHGIYIVIDDVAAYELYQNRKELMKDSNHKILTDKIRIVRTWYDSTYLKRGSYKVSIDKYELEISPEVEVSVDERGRTIIGIKYKENGKDYKQEVTTMKLRHIFTEYGYYKR